MIAIGWLLLRRQDVQRFSLLPYMPPTVIRFQDCWLKFLSVDEVKIIQMPNSLTPHVFPALQPLMGAFERREIHAHLQLIVDILITKG